MKRRSDEKKIVHNRHNCCGSGGLLWLPLSNYPISLAVMKVYSGIHKSNSVMEQKGISLEIPGGELPRRKTGILLS